MTSRQRQRSGAGSEQTQVAGDYVVVQGVSEKRAAEIAKEQANIARREFTAEANSAARDRMDNFDEKVVRELSVLGLLQSFSDPAFQLLLRKAQLEAAATPDDADHDMLAKLLAERAQHPSKPMHLAVTRSVEVIEYLDQEALNGLTLYYFATSILPALPDPKLALKMLDDLAAKLVHGPLPAGGNWLSRLDILNCIHFEPTIGFRSWDTIMFQKRPGYVSEGILPNDADGITGRLLAIHDDLTTLVVPHSFLPGRARINTGSSATLLDTLRQPMQELGKLQDLEAILKDAKVDTTDNDAIASMTRYVESELPHLQVVRSWFNDVKGHIWLTSVGFAIAYSNARRFDDLDGLGSLADNLKLYT